MGRGDLYGDGWRSGKNLARDCGPFPPSHTTLVPALDVSSPAAGIIDSDSRIFSKLVESQSMRAIMTDVQQAIEQLGREPLGDNDYQSFSFSSSKSEDDFDISDLDDNELQARASWHKGARMKLAERAKKEIEKRGAMRSYPEPTSPVKILLSEDSDSEDVDHSSYSAQSRHLSLVEDVEDVKEADKNIGEPQNPYATSNDPHLRADQQIPGLPFPINSPTSDRQHNQGYTISHLSATSPLKRLSLAFTQDLDHDETSLSFSSPSGSIPGISACPDANMSKFVSLRSLHPVGSMSPPFPSSSDNTFVDEKEKEKEKQERSQATEWTVEEVVDWLKGRGFDQDVCDKFAEQEITGDVLLDLDVNVLKSEIGILAFGKRMRIANAISDLRRPFSIIAPDHRVPARQSLPLSPLSPLTTHSLSSHRTSLTPSQSASQVHSYSRRSISHSISHQSVSSPGHVSHQNSLGSSPSRILPSHNENSKGIYMDSAPTNRSVEYITEEVSSPESTCQRVQVELSNSISNGEVALSSSPSDSALNVPTTPFEQGDNECASRSRNICTDSLLASHGEAPKVEKESHYLPESGNGGGEWLSIFGGPFTGTSGKSRKPAPELPGPTEDVVMARSPTSKFSLSRLHSGNSKRVVSSSDILNGSGVWKKSARSRKSLVPISIIKESKEELHDSTTVLRNRAFSAPSPPSMRSSCIGPQANGGFSPLKEGQSVLSQIGEPDYSGWMQKRGEKYGGHYWKLRYFVLKGQHLYWLKSDSVTDTKAKGYTSIAGYKVTLDEGINPGKYGFRMEHDQQKTHYFSSDELAVVRNWMKAILKATIDRDYTIPVVSSCSIPTIPLAVAQAMDPAPRPPSPGSREAAQKALRRENLNDLSTRDARVLMGIIRAGDGSKSEEAPLASKSCEITRVGCASSESIKGIRKERCRIREFSISFRCLCRRIEFVYVLQSSPVTLEDSALAEAEQHLSGLIVDRDHQS